MNSTRECALIKFEQMLDLILQGDEKVGRFVHYPDNDDMLSIKIEVTDVKKALGLEEKK